MSKTENPVLSHTALGPIEYLERRGNESTSLGTVVAVHGAMGGYDQSNILAKAIGPQGYQYIAVSRPGYLGTPLEGRESPEHQADLLAALLDAKGLGRVTIMAISGGGYSALYFALRHPDRCRALILCSTTGGKNDVPVPFAFTLMKGAAKIPFLTKLMANKFENNIERSLKRSISHPDVLETMMKDVRMMSYYKELTLSTMNCMEKRIPGTINDIRITKEREYPLEDISVPTLVIHGTDDPVVPYGSHGKKLAETIPGAQLCLCDKGEHMAIFTHNEQVSGAVGVFLESLVN